MATYFQDDFTAADGTSALDVGMTLAYGSSAATALIRSNRLGCGSIANERIFRTLSYPGVTDYRGGCNLRWYLASSRGRKGGLGVRVQSNGEGYYLLIDCDFGSPKVCLRYFSGTTWTNLDGPWKSVATAFTVAEMEAGLNFYLQVQNTSAGVRLKAIVNNTLVYDFTDTNSRIGSGGTLAVYMDNACVGGDITFDDLVALDFESEATLLDIDSGSGLVLVLDGVYYDKTTWKSMGLEVIESVVGYEATSAGRVADSKRFHEPVLYSGQDIKIQYDGVTVCSGILRQATHALSVAEGNEYEIASALQMAFECPLQDPKTHSGTMTFNSTMEKQSEGDTNKLNKTVGNAIKYILDNHLNGDDNLRDLGAAPPGRGTLAYDLSELGAMTVKVPNMTVSGSVGEAIIALMNFCPEFGVRIDPDTKRWHFDKRSESSYNELDLASESLTGSIQERPDLNQTAVLIRGSRPKATVVTNKFSAGQIQKGWASSFETTYTPTLAFKNKDAAKVTAVGVNGDGNPYVDVSGLTMVANEWVRCVVTFDNASPAAGSSFYVKSNTTSRFVFSNTGWPGFAPVVGNTLVVQGTDDQNARNNAYNEAFRTYILPTPPGGGAQSWLTGRCASATVTVKNPEGGFTKFKTKVTIKTPDDGTASTATLDTPAVQPLGLVNYPNEGCDPGKTSMADDVEITAPVMDVTDPDTNNVDDVATKRFPTRGYYGTAYSFDSTKWSGGGTPGRGDAKVRRVLVIEDPDYTTGAEDTEYERMATSILKVVSSLARSGDLTRKGIDTSYVALNRRIRIKDTRASNPPNAPRVTGFETSTDLWLIGVTYLWGPGTMTLSIGTQSGLGKFDIGAQRQVFVENTRFDQMKKEMEQAMELLSCLQQNTTGGGFAPPPSPTKACGSQVSGATSGGGGSVSVDCTTDSITTSLNCDVLCGTVSAADLDALWYACMRLDNQHVTEANFGDYICCVMNVVNWIGKWLYSWAYAVDHELGDGKADITALHNCITAMVTVVNQHATVINAMIACLNNRLIQIDNCFRNKMDWPGSDCGLLPCSGAANTTTCVMTPALCDPACAMVKPTPEPVACV